MNLQVHYRRPSSDDHCGECDAGYYLQNKQCLPFLGDCANGALADVAARTQENHCGSCDISSRPVSDPPIYAASHFYYSAQVQLLQEAVGGIAQVATVDSIQGSEYDFVILSCVRTGHQLGFLSSDSRVNVALSRARQLMAIVGCHDSLETLSSWRHYLQFPQRLTPDGFLRSFPRADLAELARSQSHSVPPQPHRASLGGWALAVSSDLLFIPACTPSPTPPSARRPL